MENLLTGRIHINRKRRIRIFKEGDDAFLEIDFQETVAIEIERDWPQQPEKSKEGKREDFYARSFV